jgi:hypothetical protein
LAAPPDETALLADVFEDALADMEDVASDLAAETELGLLVGTEEDAAAEELVGGALDVVGGGVASSEGPEPNTPVITGALVGTAMLVAGAEVTAGVVTGGAAGTLGTEGIWAPTMAAKSETVKTAGAYRSSETMFSPWGQTTLWPPPSNKGEPKG